MTSAIALAVSLAVAPVAPPPTSDGFERLEGFATVLVNHLNHVLGTEKLPTGLGLPIEPGVFVTVTRDRFQIFDQDAGTLRDGRITDNAVAPQCDSKCPAVLFDTFQRNWLDLAVEAQQFRLELPSRVVFGVDASVPAKTLLQMAYAVAETRPVQPPQLSLLVNSPRRGLRAQPFFLIPPKGLYLAQGSAALGLTIRVGRGRYEMTAADPRFARQVTVTSKVKLQALVRGAKKRYPNKDVVVFEPDDSITVSELMELVTVVRDDFSLVVLSAGQPIDLP